MTTKEMYDKGLRCKGRGFNCNGCKDKNLCVEYTDSGLNFDKLSTKYIKLRCEAYYCNTNFLVEISNKDIREFYICPECESLVFTDKEDEIIEIS